MFLIEQIFSNVFHATVHSIAQDSPSECCSATNFHKKKRKKISLLYVFGKKYVSLQTQCTGVRGVCLLPIWNKMNKLNKYSFWKWILNSKKNSHKMVSQLLEHFPLFRDELRWARAMGGFSLATHTTFPTPWMTHHFCQCAPEICQIVHDVEAFYRDSTPNME